MSEDLMTDDSIRFMKETAETVLVEPGSPAVEPFARALLRTADKALSLLAQLSALRAAAEPFVRAYGHGGAITNADWDRLAEAVKGT